MENTSTITPTVYIFYPEIPKELQLPAPEEEMQHLECIDMYIPKNRYATA